MSDDVRAGGAGIINRWFSHGMGAVVLLRLLSACSGGGSAPGNVFGGRRVQGDQQWPQELMGGDGSMGLLYQPQVEGWKNYKLLKARMAVAVPVGARD